MPDRAPTSMPAGYRILGGVKGLRPAATDLGWSTGDGPWSRSPGEALLMTIAGRGGIVAELSGPGVATLAGQISG